MRNEAVKLMKIGGRETEIVLNPLTAMRKASFRAMHQKRRLLQSGKPDDKHNKSEQERSKKMQGLPFPASVLPEEAQQALGLTGSSTRSSGSSDQPRRPKRVKEEI